MAPAAASRALALDLLRSQRGNVVFSPQSIATALAMSGMGAARQTAQEIAATLHLRGPAAFGAVGDLQDAIVESQASAAVEGADPPNLKIANGLFLQHGFPVKPRFSAALRNRFESTVTPVDFARDMPAALATINDWVAARTEGLIPTLFTELSSLTRLVLTNAVYLDADWRHPFNPARNTRAAFRTPNGPVRTEFMNQRATLRTGFDEAYEAVELPYRDSTLSLLVVVPSAGTIGRFERWLRPSRLTRLIRDLSRREILLDIPRFHMRWRKEMKGALRSLGISTAFGAQADFSRITERAQLRIGTIMHVADLGVDEAGTVAAAATGVGVEAVSLPPSIVADRPFLFFLRDRKSGAILFAGRVVDPAATTD